MSRVCLGGGGIQGYNQENQKQEKKLYPINKGRRIQFQKIWNPDKEKSLKTGKE